MNKLYNMNLIPMPYGYIKPIDKFEDFEKVINVFKEPPFSEPLSLKDKLEEYNEYLKHGLALGYYTSSGEIMGYAGIMQGVKKDHMPFFDSNIKKLNSFYIYGLATRKEYRGKYMVCSSLVQIINKIATNNQIDFIYLRISATGSKSEHLCIRLGYDNLYKNGNIPIQSCSFIRIDGKMQTDKRRFLIMPTSQKGHIFLFETGTINHPYEKKVIYEKKDE